MVKTVIIRKRTIFIYGLLVLVLAIGVVVLETFINKSNNDEYITYAQAAKMIAYANVDDTQALKQEKCGTSHILNMSISMDICSVKSLTIIL